MKQLILIVFFLFMAVVLYLISLPPKELTIKDIQPEVYPRIITDEPEAREIAAVDSTKEVLRPVTPGTPAKNEIKPIVSAKKDADVQSNVEYYIIVGGFPNLIQAQQKAAKFRTDFEANIIVLPPTSEGLYRISYGKYSGLEEAKALIQSIRTKVRSDAWIFSLKR